MPPLPTPAEQARMLAQLGFVAVESAPELATAPARMAAAPAHAAAAQPPAPTRTVAKPVIAPAPAAAVTRREIDFSSPALDRMAREGALAAIAAEAGACKACELCMGRNKVVPGIGDPMAELMFIGEGPGQEEDRTGEPFVGAAGQLLTKIIIAMGLTREHVFIANVVKCRPPGNRVPEPAEMRACLPFLERQIAAIRPRMIVTLGMTALRGLYPETEFTLGITRLRGQWLKLGPVDVMPTFHPSYLLRNPKAKHEVWADMQQVMGRLKSKG